MFDNIDIKNAKESEVVEAVISEIKTFGDDTGKQFVEMQKNYADLKDLVEKGADSALDKEQLQKLADDISTRQSALDDIKTAQDAEAKATAERIDAVEVALKRIGKSKVNTEQGLAEAKAFHSAVMATKGGATFETIGLLAQDGDSFKKYCEAFDPFLRKYGGNSQMPMTPDMSKALLVGSDPDGGYVVTPEMSARIIKRLYEGDALRQLASVQSITTGALEMLVDWDDTGAAWESETDITTNQETPKLDKKRIVVHPMATRPKISQTLLEDAGINVQQWLADKVANKFMRTEGASFITGDGIGKPRGILSYTSGTTYGTVEQVVSGAADALTASGLITLKYTLKEYFLNRASFIMNRATVAEVMKLTNAVTGEFVWKPSFQKDEEATILSLPVKMSTTMPVSAASALSVAIADWKEAYMIVDRLGITMQRDPYTAKPFIEFYTRKRVGGDIVNYDAIKLQKCST